MTETERPDGQALADDPIVAEVRAVREAQFAAAGYDLEEYARRLRTAQAASGHPVVSRPPRPAHEPVPDRSSTGGSHSLGLAGDA